MHMTAIPVSQNSAYPQTMAGQAEAAGHHFLTLVRAEIAALPLPAVEITAALVAVQIALPKALGDWILAELGLRANLHSVSPAAIAAMHIGGVSNFMHTGVHLPDNTSEFALLRALSKEEHLETAAEFLEKLANLMTEFPRLIGGEVKRDRD